MACASCSVIAAWAVVGNVADTPIANTAAKIARFIANLGFTLVESKDAVPVALHADHGPAVLLRLAVELRRKPADLGVGQPARRAVGVFALRVVVQHQH